MATTSPIVRANQPLVGLAVPMRYLLAVAASVIVMVAVYWPALHGQLLWDDDLVTKPELRSLSGLARIWTDPTAAQQYYPLLHTTFWIEYKIWGEQTFGYHVVNLLLHVTACWLLFAALQKLCVPGAWLATAIFALHPVQVETVAWITEQKNTLSAVFYFGAALAYLCFDESRKMSAYITALILFALALLSKTTAVTLPAALLIVFWWQRGKLSWRRDVAPLIPFFLLGLAAGLFTAWVEWKYIEAQGPDFQMTFVQRGLLACRAIWFYLRTLVWPDNLVYVYPRWNIDPHQWWQWTFVAATVAMTLFLWTLRRKWRAPLAGWLFFVGTLFPALGFFNVYIYRFTFVADHFQYIACLGIIVPFVGSVTMFAKRLSASVRQLAIGLAVALLGVLAFLSRWQSQMYKSPMDIYNDVLENNPTCWVADNNLGRILFDRNYLIEAAQHYWRSIELKPDFAEAHYNLAHTLIALGRIQEAIDQYEQVLALEPDHADTEINLAEELMETGRRDEAVRHLEHVVSKHPNLAAAQSKLGQFLAIKGQSVEAIEHYRKAISLNGEYAPLRNDLGVELALTGQTQEAIEQFQQAIHLDPNFLRPYTSLATLYARSNRLTDAIAVCRKARDIAQSNGQEVVAAQFQSLIDKYRDSLRPK